MIKESLLLVTISNLTALNIQICVQQDMSFWIRIMIQPDPKLKKVYRFKSGLILNLKYHNQTRSNFKGANQI